MRAILLVLGLGGLLAVSLAVAGYLWWRMGDVQMSLNGVIALGLGILVSFMLGAGLMTLVFYSSRRGHDETQVRPGDNGES